MKKQFMCMLSSPLIFLLFVLAESRIINSKRRFLVDSIHQHDDPFVQCLHSQDVQNNTIFSTIYTPRNSSFSSLLTSSIQNLRFAAPNLPKPVLIVTPLNENQIRPVILCAKTHNLLVKVRCGGHDYEGLSYVSQHPFVVIDMRNFKMINVDVQNKVAWVQGGSLLGEVYHKITSVSKTLAFPGGLCPSVGVGGHVSGGGIGTLDRKYGLAADNVVDAKIMNVKGEVLDRRSMGEDLFWAIRGGGMASFGVLLEWKFTLVDVPEIVTVFRLNKTLEQNGTTLVHKWQEVAKKSPKELFIRVVISQLNVENGRRRTAQITFECLYLGRVDRLVQEMGVVFPQLGLKREECKEMSWIESVVFFSGLPSSATLNDLIRPPTYPKTYYKAKSDLVNKPLHKPVLDGLWKTLFADEAKKAQFIFHPYGGTMDEIIEDEIPFPHRNDSVYEIQHLVYWDEVDNGEATKFIDWIRNMYNYLTPYVSKSPRTAYFSYIDLDLGVNNHNGTTTFDQAKVWGTSYFKDNFYRLAQIKTKVDPDNFFRSQQSIPLL